MSFARFSNGDVYVFATELSDGRAVLECCACIRCPPELFHFIAASPASMLLHLRGDHEAAGDEVPQRAYDALELLATAGPDWLAAMERYRVG